MFFEDSHGHSAIVLHLIDECIRWTVVVEAASKEGVELIRLITIHWLQLFGAMKTLIFDGETSLRTDQAAEWADRWGYQLHHSST